MTTTRRNGRPTDTRDAVGMLAARVGSRRSPALARALALTLALTAAFQARGGEAVPLPGTRPLTLEGDIASNLVAGVDRFLLRELDASVERRARYWPTGPGSPEAWVAAVRTNRGQLAHILGVRDRRPPTNRFEILGSLANFEPARGGRDRGTTGGLTLARGSGYVVYAVRWEALDDVHGEGLLLRPLGKVAPEPESLRHDRQGTDRTRSAPVVIAVPDADQTPDQIAGLAPGVPAASQFARRLAESGCEVLVPTLIGRQAGRGKISNREFLYRPAFELGRHIVGYEVQKLLAAVDCFITAASPVKRASPAVTDAPDPLAAGGGGALPTIGLIGWGEGGMLALYAGALDPRIDVVCVSGYFDQRERVWQEPVYRNVFGLLDRFGDAELAALVSPRALIVEAARGPEVTVPPGTGGAPGRLTTPRLESVRAEVERARRISAGVAPRPELDLIVSGDGTGPYATQTALSRFVRALRPRGTLRPDSRRPPQITQSPPEPAARQARQLHEIDQHTQRLLTESPYVRREFLARLDTSSLAKYEASVASYREFFARDVIGRFDRPLLPPDPRSRRAYETDRWIGYEVVLDVFQDVIAYGILCVPKGLAVAERRPVVVCQHGLEGRPQDIIQGDHEAYHDFASKLAERGFVTFAPQNLYLFGDRFRTLQRKANPLGKTLFSVIVPQHQQITDWLKSLPFVDPARIGFYGLSYGGKTAMRVPALVTNYCLSICSADFNDWVWKNASTRSPYSYVGSGEYEIFEFDLGSTFNYAEMAALIAPRPFMVERGHFDGVAPDEAVAYEFAKVRNLYQARLGLGDRCAIEWFVGPHTIHGVGTFEFLHRHLAFPRPDAR